MAAIDTQGLCSPMIHEKVAHWAALTPDSVAVRNASEILTYAELDRQSSALACYLSERGIGTGSLVGLYFQPSPATLVCMLGILKSGAAYVPLDIANPVARLVQMVGQLADLKLIFTSASFRTNLGEQAAAIADIEQVRKLLEGLSVAQPRHWTVQQDALCYIVFTSGTTGIPKAVAITHRSWANLIDWHVREYELGQDSNGILVSAYGFDISQRSLVTPLYSGAAISLTNSRIFDGYEITSLIEQHQVASIHLAPSSLYLILQAGQAGEQLASLRHLFIGGEALSTARVVGWAKDKGVACNLIHQYGVAECTDVATCHRMVDYDTYLTDGIPMGEPVGNCRVDVLDEHNCPVAVGETGQIVISGIGVGQGYLNNPTLQAERFRSITIEGVALTAYFTGDYARRQTDGSFICLGRRDNQIKIRGMLVNLSEIENGIRNALATVEDAIVLNIQAQPGQEAELTAFVTTSDELPPPREIGRQLSALLPNHMHPRRYVACRQFPLTQNGKIDRQALLGMGSTTHHHQ